MKKKIIPDFSIAMVLTSILLFSCDRFGEDSDTISGRLQISFVNGGELFTKAYQNIPDTADFLLTIRDASGNLVYDGKYGDCRETLEVTPGTYNVRVVSSEFAKPSFECPQFGDEQCVVVPADGVGKVHLLCRQMNAGVRLVISPLFLEACTDAVLFLKAEDFKLMYSYSERRTAYCPAGTFSLVMSEGGHDEVLMVRELAAAEMLTLNVNVAEPVEETGYGMSVQVDTSRVWIEDTCVIGGTEKGTEHTSAMSVSEARNSVGKTDVWVCGYVVGGNLTASSASFEPPFKSRTNILIGPRSSTIDRDVCMSVQLPEGNIREKLNLVDNPGIHGARICIKGDIAGSYFGLPGIKNSKEFKIY